MLNLIQKFAKSIPVFSLSTQRKKVLFYNENNLNVLGFREIVKEIVPSFLNCKWDIVDNTNSNFNFFSILSNHSIQILYSILFKLTCNLANDLITWNSTFQKKYRIPTKEVDDLIKSPENTLELFILLSHVFYKKLSKKVTLRISGIFPDIKSISEVYQSILSQDIFEVNSVSILNIM